MQNLSLFISYIIELTNYILILFFIIYIKYKDITLIYVFHISIFQLLLYNFHYLQSFNLSLCLNVLRFHPAMLLFPSFNFTVN